MRTPEDIKLVLTKVHNYWRDHPSLSLLDVISAAQREVDINMRLDTMSDRDVVAGLSRLTKRARNPGKFYSSV